MLVSEPFEDLGGRLLLGVLAAGFTGVGLLSMFMAPLDSDATEYVFAMSAGVAILGVLGLIGAAVGRALARWLLVAVGIVVVASLSMASSIRCGGVLTSLSPSCSAAS